MAIISMDSFEQWNAESASPMRANLPKHTYPFSADVPVACQMCGSSEDLRIRIVSENEPEQQSLTVFIYCPEHAPD